MNKRNMIPESNGLYRVNMKEKISKAGLLKRISFVIIAIFLIGFIFQTVSNFIGNERVSSSLRYAKVNNDKMEYKYSGSGDYTVVFDGAIGTNLYQWDDICKKLNESGVKTFVYNRNGYGFNSYADGKTIENQAEDLKILLRKAGASGKLILVGEEYGSLVSTCFANKYPENVAAMFLIKPLDENTIKSKEFKKDIKWTYLKSKIEALGTMFGLTTLLDSFDATYSIDVFEKSLKDYEKDEFEVKKNRKEYRQAISSELGNLYNYNYSFQKDGLLSEKPLYIISNKKNDSLISLSNSKYITVYKTESKEKIISVTDKDAVINGISNILRDLKKINKLNK